MLEDGERKEESFEDEEMLVDPEEESAVELELEGFLDKRLGHIISEVSSFLVILPFLFLFGEDCFLLLVDFKLVFRRIPRSFLFKLLSYQEGVSDFLVILFLTFGAFWVAVDMETLAVLLGLEGG
jgi:hypothetical protein